MNRRDAVKGSTLTATASLLASLLLAACGGGGDEPVEAAAASAPASSAAAASDGPTATIQAASTKKRDTTATAATSGISPVAAPQVLATVAALSTASELATSNAAAWPFAQPPLATLRASPRKVFAHYFTPFPISLDNQAPAADYYSVNYLSPTGEGSKFYNSGGFIKQRPLPRNTVSGNSWDVTDVSQDVRRAAALGIDGFAVDMLASSGVHWDRVLRVLNTAAALDSGFKVVLMPDMEAEFKWQPDKLLPALRTLAAHPAAYRLADGRLVLAPYNAQNRTAAWWAQLINTLRAEGINVAFWPVFQGWGNHAAAFAPISHTMSDWGDRSPGTNRPWLDVPARAHAMGQQWMATVSPQDARAKDLLYWEARNSENYRVMWENAINGGADAVHIVTWNDYSEGTEVAPSSGTQWSFYDLTAYYTTWFKTGVRPALTRDVLHYFHRNQATTALPQPGKQPRAYTRGGGSDAAANDIEVLAFATAPGTVRITIGTQVTQQAVPAGLSSVRVPLAEGTPSFELLRGTATVASVRSGFAISNTIGWQDLLYRAGASTRALVAPR